MLVPGIPDKTYYKIGEVARCTAVKTSVLRFWETEFPFLSPEKSSTGQRLYTKQDIALVQQIKQMLYQDKYTIEGVRQKLAPRSSAPSPAAEPTCPDTSQALLREVRQALLAIRALL